MFNYLYLGTLKEIDIVSVWEPFKRAHTHSRYLFLDIQCLR